MHGNEIQLNQKVALIAIHKMLIKNLKKFLNHVLQWVCQTKNKERIVAGLFTIPAVFMLLPMFSFTITLFQSFLFQGMLAYGFFSAYWIYKRHYRVAATNFLIYVLLLIKVSAPMDLTLNVVEGKEQLSVLQFNVLATNESYSETVARVKMIDADLVAFQEVNELWGASLESGLKEQFPFYKIATNWDEGQGIAVFSKKPLIDVEVFNWIGTQNITGKIKISDKEINFVCLHTKSPMTKERYINRNEHLKIAEEYIGNQEGEFLVLGDFNTVPWDNRLESFRTNTKLRDSRKKLTPTYPSWNPFFAQIPIDYIFHSNGIGCDQLDAIRITSDHRAILGSFLLR